MEDNKSNPPSGDVHVQASARLHLGFLDIQGGLGRKFGSLGLSICGINTTLLAKYADNIDVIGPSSERARHYAKQVLSHFGINGGINILIKSAIPEHTGLGSGTQLSLAVATAVARLYGLSESATQLAMILHRGERSGIGIGTFTQGGFIVDAGRGTNTVVPPVISQLQFPVHWRLIIIFDDGIKGINGYPEQRAFKTLVPMSEKISGLLCRLTLMQVLPAISEHDCSRFGQAITQIQGIIGDYFAKVQGGRYTSHFLKSILESLINEGAAGVGQSSWGPTGFAFFPNETIAFQALKKIRAKWQSESRLRFIMSQAHNSSATISVNKINHTISDENLKVENL